MIMPCPTMIAAALTLFWGLLCEAKYLPTIEVKNRRFVDSLTGDPFYIKGVDYQPGGESGVGTKHVDPLSDVEACKRDSYLFQTLGINTIRVYSVAPQEDHNECMSILAQAGIYVILDVNSPLSGQHLNRLEPWTTYESNYLRHTMSVVEQFSGYPNTLAFFAGNEIINDVESAQVSAPYIRAVIRDMKNYIANHVPRKIPVGYSNADDLLFRATLPEYLTCGQDTENIDFLGVNSYQWCGHQSLYTSGYDKLISDYSNATIPILFSEYGCNLVLPRLFEETQALYEKEMSSVFSGGLVYEFTQEANDYGLVEIQKNGTANILADFDMLMERFEAVSLNNQNFDTLPSADSSERCKESTFTIFGKNQKTPLCADCNMIAEGFGRGMRGKFIEPKSRQSKYPIVDSDGNEIEDTTVKKLYDLDFKTSESRDGYNKGQGLESNNDELQGNNNDSKNNKKQTGPSKKNLSSSLNTGGSLYRQLIIMFLTHFFLLLASI